jgi:hypothetical protein
MIWVAGLAGSVRVKSREKSGGYRDDEASELGLPPWWLNEQASAYEH